MNSDTKARFLGLIGLGIIAVWMTLSLASGFYFSIISLSWPKVPVRITSSAVYTGSSSVGRWFAPDVEYEYRLWGRDYHSDTIRYLMQSFYERQDAQTVLAPYSREAQATASYDPQNPARSVLEPGVPSSMWKRALIPIFIWALIAYIFYEIVRPDRRLLLRPSAELSDQE